VLGHARKLEQPPLSCFAAAGNGSLWKDPSNWSGLPMYFQALPRETYRGAFAPFTPRPSEGRPTIGPNSTRPWRTKGTPLRSSSPPACTRTRLSHAPTDRGDVSRVRTGERPPGGPTRCPERVHADARLSRAQRLRPPPSPCHHRQTRDRTEDKSGGTSTASLPPTAWLQLKARCCPADADLSVADVRWRKVARCALTDSGGVLYFPDQLISYFGKYEPRP
jgi:hypothetical protein